MPKDVIKIVERTEGLKDGTGAPANWEGYNANFGGGMQTW